jgi:hypothetical protein
MADRVTVMGVHPKETNEPVHLIEIEIEGAADQFDFGDITQEDPDRPRENWQAAYDERDLGQSNGRRRFAFFFHYLDLDKPLLTSFGPVGLPEPTPMPAHLQAIEYEAP